MTEPSPEQPKRAALRTETRCLELKFDQLPNAFLILYVLRALKGFPIHRRSKKNPSKQGQ